MPLKAMTTDIKKISVEEMVICINEARQGFNEIHDNFIKLENNLNHIAGQIEQLVKDTDVRLEHYYNVNNIMGEKIAEIENKMEIKK